MQEPGDRWRVGLALGTGGTSAVYGIEPEDPNVITPPLAAKLLHGAYASESARRLLEHEARILQALNDIDGVVTLHELAWLDTEPALLMHRLDGVDLSALVARPLPGGVVIELLLAVARVLAAAVALRLTPESPPLQLVHGDLKPANLFLTRTGRVKVLDLGHARMMGHSDAPRGSTEGYVAPERRWGGPTETPAVDVFSLGMVAVYLLTDAHPVGVPADGGDHGAWLAQRRERLSMASVDPALAALVLQCLAREPGERPSAADLVSTLEAWRTPAAAERLATLAATADFNTASRPGPWTGRVVVRRTFRSLISSSRMPSPEVVRPRLQAAARRLLARPGTPIVAYGPSGSGKSWFLRELVAALPAGTPHVWLDLALWPPEAYADADAALAALVRVLAIRLRAPEPALTGRSAAAVLDELIEERLLEPAHDQGVLVIDHLEVWARQWPLTALLAPLRAMLDRAEPPWDRLRLAVAVSREPSRLIPEERLSPFSHAPPLLLADVEDELLLGLAGYRGLTLSAAEAAGLRAALGGNLRLLCTALDAVAAGAASLPLGPGVLHGHGIFGDHLRRQLAQIQAAPRVAAALRSVLGGRPPRDFDAEDELLSLGVVARRDGRLAPACTLVERFYGEYLGADGR